MSARRDRVASLAELGEHEHRVDFDALYRRFAPYVGSIALRILGRDDEVDDVVQDVFLDAHRGLEALRDPQAVKGWLARVAVRRAVRKLQKRRLLSLFRREPDEGYARVADPSASPEVKALLADVYTALDLVDAKDRAAWVLRYLQGEDLEAIAALTGASLATVKRRVARANDTVRKATSGGPIDG